MTEDKRRRSLRRTFERLARHMGVVAELRIVDGQEHEAFVLVHMRAASVVSVSTALTRESAWAVRAVLAHELGHVGDRHWCFARGAAIAFLGIAVSTALEALGHSSLRALAAAAAAIMWVGKRILDREAEYRADESAARAVGKRDVLDLLGYDLTEEAALTLRERIVRAVRYPHPSVSRRIARVQALDRPVRRSARPRWWK